MSCSLQVRLKLANVSLAADCPRLDVPSVDVRLKRPLKPVETKGTEDDERPLLTRPVVATSHGRTEGDTVCRPQLWLWKPRTHSCPCECLSAAAHAPPMPLPALKFLRSNATPTLILCCPGACFPLPPCGHHCPSRGISSISIFAHLHPPSTPAAMFYLQDQMTYIPGPAAPLPLPLPLPSRWPQAGTAGVAARLDRNRHGRHGHPLKAIRLSCAELAKFENSKTKLHSPEKETGKASSHQCRHKYFRFPFLGKCCFIPTVSEYRSKQAHDPVYLLLFFFLSNIIIPFNMIRLIITCY